MAPAPTFWSELLHFGNIANPGLQVLGIFLYEAACAIFLWWSPSELPMFLFQNLSRVTVLLSCALGKAAGSLIVFKTGDRFRRSPLFHKSVVILERFLRKIRLWGYWSRINRWSYELIESHGLAGYILITGIPGMPMRSANYAVALLGSNPLRFASAAAAATIIRNSAVYFGYQFARNVGATTLLLFGLALFAVVAKFIRMRYQTTKNNTEARRK